MEGYAVKPYDWIYLIEILGDRFAVDTRSGRRLRLRDETWNYLASSVPDENGDPDSTRDPGSFSPAAHLVPTDLDTIERSVAPPSPLPDDPLPVLQTMTLNVVHACNLKCSYCFEDWPSLREGYNTARGRMSAEVARASVEMLIRESGEHRRLILSFFGGEPLLNWAVVRSTILYAQERAREHDKEFHFTLTTNGTLLDEEKQTFLIDHGVEVVLSIDGKPSTHDRFRIFHDGKGSSQLVLERAREFRERLARAEGSRASLTIRGTYFRPTIDFEESSFFLAEQGFESVSMENGVLRPEDPVALRPEDLPELRQRYNHFVRRLADELIRKKRTFRFFHMVRAMQAVGMQVPRTRECGAGTGYLAVDPTGDLYPCHKFVGLHEVQMGTVAGGVTRPEIGRELWQTNVETKAECRVCWARYFCGGGCHADAHLIHGRFNRPDPVSCELLRHRTRLGLYLYKRLEEEAPGLLREMVEGKPGGSYRPLRATQTRATPREECLLVYNPSTRRIHELNHVAAAIWELCDGKRSLDEIGDLVAEIFEIPPTEARGDAAEAVDVLMKMELVS